MVDRNNLTKVHEEDVLMWGYTMFPHYFRDMPPMFHKEIIDMAESPDCRKLVVAAPREFAKSTLLAFLYTFHKIVFKKKHFIVIICNSEKKAVERIRPIKKELLENPTLLKSMPKIELTKDTEDDIIIKFPDGFEVRVLARGVKQMPSIRGSLQGAWRPDFILCDDMEDDELVRSQERRKQLEEDFDTALIPAGDRKNCDFVVIGTILHDDSQMSKLVNEELYTDFKKMFYKALIETPDQPDISLWPEKMTVEDLYELRKLKPLTFAKEYQNDPVSGQNTRFQATDFRTWKNVGPQAILLGEEAEVIAKHSFKDCKAAIACDLAWSSKKTADYAVILPALLTPDSDILVWTYVNQRNLRPDKVAEYIFSYVSKLEALTGSTVPVGFEKAMLENVTQWILKQEMRKRNKFLICKQLKWDHDKITRIEVRLQPRYNQHTIYHLSGMGDLEYQLTRFPYGAHDDLPDALQGVVQLLKNPKKKGKMEEDDDDKFKWLQRLAQGKLKKHRGRYQFGKRRNYGIPAQETIFGNK